MAQVTTVQQPTYAVQDALRNFLFAFAKLNETQQEAVHKQAQLCPKLTSLATVHCASYKDAVELTKIVNESQPIQPVVVSSFTEFGVTYEVGVTGQTPVSCTCPDFTNRSKSNPNHTCKHMDAVSRRPGAYGL